MSEVRTVAVRFHLDREEDRRAYEFLQGKGRIEYRSHSRAIVAALDEFFSQEEQTGFDNTLLEKIEQAVARGVQTALREIQTSDVMKSGAPFPVEADSDENADYDIAMEFIDALCN